MTSGPGIEAECLLRSVWECAFTRMSARRAKRQNSGAPRSSRTFVSTPGWRWMWWRSSCWVGACTARHLYCLLVDTPSPVSSWFMSGPAESGKSTLIKQIKIIHSHGFSKQELITFKVLSVRLCCPPGAAALVNNNTSPVTCPTACRVGQPVDLYEVCTSRNGHAAD